MSRTRRMRDDLNILVFRISYNNDWAITVMEAVITDTPQTTFPSAFRGTKPWMTTKTTQFDETSRKRLRKKGAILVATDGRVMMT